MTRRFGAFVLALPLAAIVPAASALAQSYPPSQPYYSSAPPPPRGYQLDPNDPDIAIRRPVREAQQPARGVPYPEADAAPAPPPFTPFNGQYTGQDAGHQLDAQPDDQRVVRPPGAIGSAPNAAPQQAAPPENSSVMTLPPEDQPETGQPKELPANLKKQMVDFPTKEPAGTIVIDTPHTYLYLVLGNGRAMRYGIGVGREGFTWAGTERISRMKEWPDWFPPSEMIERQPYLPRMMAGGPGNPLGARALYLGNTLYRIHGTNQPSTIGQYVSSGCIRLLNGDIEDLFSRVQVGTRVVVLPSQSPPQTAANGAVPAPSSAANVSPPTINGLTGQPMKSAH
jgi:lipoprotein-anchoring transpeptidase ErfK/SrfK